MPIHPILATALLATFALPTPVRAGENIAGTWSSVARTKGGLGRQWNFGTDGTVVFTFGAVVDFHYELEGDKLRMRLVGPSADATAAPILERYIVRGDELTVEPIAAGEKQVMKRVGPARKGLDPIIGQWMYKHYTGGMATFRYGANNRVQLTVPIQTVTGTYKIVGDALSISFPGKPTYLRRVRQTDSQLALLATDSEPEERFSRVPE
jgi:hypothetical protein